MVGNEVVSEDNITSLTNPTGLQDESAKGWNNESPYYGTTAFSTSSSTYKGSIVEGYVEAYKTKLEEMGATFIDDTTGEHEMESASGVRLITFDELKTLGCNDNIDYTCPIGFLTETSYWSGSPDGGDFVWSVFSSGNFASNDYNIAINFGVRPVIIISSSEI